MKRHPTPGRQRGTTLVEAATVIAIVVHRHRPWRCRASGPAWQRRHIEGAAAQLETDLQLARATAVASNAGVRVQLPRAGRRRQLLRHAHRRRRRLRLHGRRPGRRAKPGAEALRTGALRSRRSAGAHCFEQPVDPVRPRRRHRDTDRDHEGAGPQRRRGAPDRQRDGARALVLAGAGAARLSAPADPPGSRGAGGGRSATSGPPTDDPAFTGGGAAA